ncbi:MAG: chorismate-binding protein [Candidatus Eremiobacteraeota bacterium]|nr:chorismate-binding protein [Candidatus Eremiobacteraeota bacterium]
MQIATLELSADALTPISAYLALAQPGASCLLESVESGGRISRYSFIGIDYIETAQYDDDGALLDNVRAFVAQFAPSQSRSAGFSGGALVAFAYDAARSFAGLPERERARPEMPAAYVAVPATWLIFDHYTDRLTFWSMGDDLGQVERKLQQYTERLLEVRTTFPGQVKAEAVRQSIDHATYLGLLEEVKRKIFDGDVYQLQLGIRFDAELRGAPFDIYRALRSRNPSPYMFYVDTPFGQILGASPEFLVRLEGRKARIRPLAGTRARGADASEDAAIATELLSDAKERAEHVMLVDLGRNDLGAVCKVGSVQIGELMAIERYSHVMHIVSDITGELEDQRDGLDLFAAGFPAGTVTGTPKIRAMQLIDEFEPVARGFYAGSVGRLDFDGTFDSCITLRSVHVNAGRACWQASAGIVADSNAQSEYDEILHKTRIIRDVLGVTA